MRDTTPFVTEIVSPPQGYPTTVTESCIFERMVQSLFPASDALANVSANSIFNI